MMHPTSHDILCAAHRDHYNFASSWNVQDERPPVEFKNFLDTTKKAKPKINMDKRCTIGSVAT